MVIKFKATTKRTALNKPSKIDLEATTQDISSQEQASIERNISKLLYQAHDRNKPTAK